MNFPKKLQQKLTNRIASNSLRSLQTPSNLIDFYSNDYLGLANSEAIFDGAHQLLTTKNYKVNGATGSRLISGNYALYEETEQLIAKFHNTEKALLFNSGYDANVGFFAAVPQRGDIILYDELSHASIRDGIQLSNAKAYKFKHNNLSDLEHLVKRYTETNTSITNHIYIVTESVFSMDGDSPDIKKLCQIATQYNAYVIIDEAHALGVFGKNGSGLVQELGLEAAVFARIVTYGKALGCHGASVLGSNDLYKYLLNFSRSFIYTTGLSPHAVATIQIAYKHLQSERIENLHQRIQYFIQETKRLQLADLFIHSLSSIHCCVISGTERTKKIAFQLQEKGFDIKPILSPTVAEGKERLRFCLHSFNTQKEITTVLEELVLLIQ